MDRARRSRWHRRVGMDDMEDDVTKWTLEPAQCGETVTYLRAKLAEAEAQLRTARGDAIQANKDALAAEQELPQWIARAEAAEAQRDKLVEALERIKQWSEAYPVDIFPEPDMARVDAVLAENGLSLATVSASNMRHVISGVGKIAAAALKGTP